MMVRTVVVALALLLAGCASNSGPNDGETLPGADETASDTTTGPPVVEIPDEPWTTRWFLSSDGLVSMDPGAGSIPLECGFAIFMAGACDLSRAEHLSSPFDGPVHVTPQALRVELWLESDGVALGNPAFDVAVWFGTTRGSAAFTFTSTLLLTPGSPTRVELDMDFQGHPGIALPPGESLLLRVFGAHEPEGLGLHRILTGGDTPSGFELTVQNLTADPTGPINSTEEFSGSLQGGTFAECQPGASRHPFTVPADARFVNLRLESTSANPRADVDLDLFDGSTLIVHAGSPYGHEEILLAGPALAPWLGKELAVGTSICTGPIADYTVRVDIG